MLIRKLAVMILSVVTVISVSAGSVHEPEYNIETDINYYNFEDADSVQNLIVSDGQSDVIIYEEGSESVIENIKAFKSYSVTDGSGNIIWRAYPEASFVYDGSTSVCLNADSRIELVDPDWIIEDEEKIIEGNTAKVRYSMAYRFLGFKIFEKTFDVDLTCTPDGEVK